MIIIKHRQYDTAVNNNTNEYSCSRNRETTWSCSCRTHSLHIDNI